MGFSTSGSLLVIFFGLLIALGSMYAAISSTGEALADGVSDQSERIDTVHETDITIVTATWEDDSFEFTTENTGVTTIPVDELTVLVDGEYQPTEEFDEVTVDGDDSTIWKPGTDLTVAGETAEPERVKLITDIGISVAGPVEVTA